MTIAELTAAAQFIPKQLRVDHNIRGHLGAE
jgi:hypothetical protein